MQQESRTIAGSRNHRESYSVQRVPRCFDLIDMVDVDCLGQIPLVCLGCVTNMLFFSCQIVVIEGLTTMKGDVLPDTY